MKLLSRYILRNHFFPFIFGTLTVLFLFLFQYLLKFIDQLVGKGLENWVILQLIVLNLSWMLVLAVPMGLLFSTLMAFGSMGAALEITIIKSSGGSLIKMMIPMMIAGMVLSIGLFWFNDDVLPDANHQAKILLNDIKRKKPTFALESGQFTTQLDNFTILARRIDSTTRVMRSVTIYDYSKRNQINTLNADSGKIEFNADYTKLVLTLWDGEIHQQNPQDISNYRKAEFKDYIILINAGGFAFERSSAEMVARGDRELHIADMEKLVAEATSSGDRAMGRVNNEIVKQNDYLMGRVNVVDTFSHMVKPTLMDTTRFFALKAVERRISFLKNTIHSDLFQKNDFDLVAKQYSVEIHKKYSIPFACFIFVLIGCPLGIIVRGGNFGFSAAISLLFYVFYWGCLIGGEKLADRGFMSPFLSMWLGNFIVGAVGILLILRVNNESYSLPGMKYLSNLLYELPVAASNAFKKILPNKK